MKQIQKYREMKNKKPLDCHECPPPLSSLSVTSSTSEPSSPQSDFSEPQSDGTPPPVAQPTPESPPPPLPPLPPTNHTAILNDDSKSNIVNNNKNDAKVVPLNVNSTGSGPPLCLDFFKGCCTRLPCNYLHENDTTQSKKLKLRFCHDFQNKDKCKRPKCRFIHASTFEEIHFNNTGELSKIVMDDLNRKHQSGVLGPPVSQARLHKPSPAPIPSKANNAVTTNNVTSSPAKIPQEQTANVPPVFPPPSNLNMPPPNWKPPVAKIKPSNMPKTVFTPPIAAAQPQLTNNVTSTWQQPGVNKVRPLPTQMKADESSISKPQQNGTKRQWSDPKANPTTKTSPETTAKNVRPEQPCANCRILENRYNNYINYASNKIRDLLKSIADLELNKKETDERHSAIVKDLIEIFGDKNNSSLNSALSTQPNFSSVQPNHVQPNHVQPMQLNEQLISTPQPQPQFNPIVQMPNPNQPQVIMNNALRNGNAIPPVNNGVMDQPQIQNQQLHIPIQYATSQQVNQIMGGGIIPSNGMTVQISNDQKMRLFHLLCRQEGGGTSNGHVQPTQQVVTPTQNGVPYVAHKQNILPR